MDKLTQVHYIFVDMWNGSCDELNFVVSFILFGSIQWYNSLHVCSVWDTSLA
jgi:hypothetical protein